MKLLYPRSALRFWAVCVVFAPFVVQIRAQISNDDGFFDDDGVTSSNGLAKSNDDGFFDDDAINNGVRANDDGFFDDDFEYIKIPSDGGSAGTPARTKDDDDDGFFDDDPAPCKDILEIICETYAFQLFCEALDKTGLDESFVKKLSRSTVFVPSNSAFEHLFDDLNYADDLDDFSKLALQDVVEIHFEPDDKFFKFELEDQCSQTLLMENGDRTRTICEYNKSKLYQKGPRNVQGDIPRIISFDIEACNGVIHVVNRVILPSHFQTSTRKPTPRPTRKPTPRPTRKPTNHPVPKPTRYPTKRPTNHPAPKPTRNPTRNPTRKPTSPTRRPTFRPISDASCEAHPECAALGLVGDCCPTDDDKRLDCCSKDGPTRRPTPRPTPKPTSRTQKSCSAYPKCRALGLEGDCCPTDDDKKLACCFDDDDGFFDDDAFVDSCTANPGCRRLGLEGDCCPTDDSVKLDCCFERPPGTCSRHPGCAAEGLEGECCPAANGKNLECCYERGDGFPIIIPRYCHSDHDLDFSCYKFGKPECCLNSLKACPKEAPECEVGFPIIGESYCTYAPNYGCYKNGWPECCSDDPKECPKFKPGCERTPVRDDYYCEISPDYTCHELGYPSCCMNRGGESCPKLRPECNVGKRGCDRATSLPSILDFACSQRNFDILCYLMKEAEVDQLLDDSGTYTIFAPSNDAFEDLGDDKVIELLKDPTGELQDILKYHVSDRIYFEEDLTCEKKIDTLRGDTSNDFTTTKCFPGGLYQRGNGNDGSPLVLNTDIVTCNGVVHVVDKVLLP